jgi:hypothetical protein
MVFYCYIKGLDLVFRVGGSQGKRPYSQFRSLDLRVASVDDAGLRNATP